MSRCSAKNGKGKRLNIFELNLSDIANLNRHVTHQVFQFMFAIYPPPPSPPQL